MSDDSFDDDPPPSSGAPAWVVTFADLMSLLLTFFVLLLSFATMDAIRFKKVADSLKDAFGVQREIPVYDPVKGTSVVAQHFSPAPVAPAPMDEIRQTTTEKEHLELPESQKEKFKEELKRMKLAAVEAEARKLRESLAQEIESGLLTVETDALKIIVRIHEQGSFPSGSAVLKTDFEPVMKKIADAIANASGRIVIAGHTDDMPISTEWYRSNWELSASRAVTVAHGILSSGKIDEKRVVIEGHADTDPLAPNSSAENRAKNRRVEIILVQNDDIVQDPKTIHSQ